MQYFFSTQIMHLHTDHVNNKATLMITRNKWLQNT